MRRYLPVFFAAVVVLWGWASSTPVIAQEQSAKNTTADEEEWQGLPPGKGREETFYMCAPCHSLKMVTQQGLSAVRWEEAIDWMVAEQEMPPLDPADRKLIVDYLAKFYGEDRKARGGTKRRR
jgi:cytochrome c